MATVRGLIGSTGFVGGNLLRQMTFKQHYNSRNIQEIQGCEFDLLVCAGAPATMWAANRDPEGDAKNLKALSEAIRSTRTRQLVLVSSVAVFDRMDAGYTEETAAYETAKAYGRNRRQLETDLADAAENVCILRLPALFGEGLKKNFIFDLMNPVPSFVAPAKREELAGKFTQEETALVDRYFTLDSALGMFRFDREAATRSGDLGALEAAYNRVGFVAAVFTSAESRYQFYNVARLGQDIDTCLSKGISCLNICSEPMSAWEIHKSLTGRGFSNEGPGIVQEDVRTVHAPAFGRTGPYLFRKDEVMKDLLAFAGESA